MHQIKETLSRAVNVQGFRISLLIEQNRLVSVFFVAFYLQF